MKRSAMTFASAAAFAAIVLATNGPADAAVNYNSSKSNSGNLTFHPKGAKHKTPHMAMKNSGVPKNTLRKVNNTTTRSNTQHN
ncbi:MAG: hypothetical protein ABSC25_25585 [Roseiarcus sp.]